MKKAREMFWELGYKEVKTQSEKEAKRYEEMDVCGHIIIFSKHKNVMKYDGLQEYILPITNNELKAIYKQEEELGWLD